MRTKFTSTATNRVTVEYDGHDWDGNIIRVSTDYYCPVGGGYVRTGDGKQVCDGLSIRGPTLDAGDTRQEPLIDFIRREYRRSMRKNAQK